MGTSPEGDGPCESSHLELGKTLPPPCRLSLGDKLAIPWKCDSEKLLLVSEDGKSNVLLGAAVHVAGASWLR